MASIKLSAISTRAQKSTDKEKTKAKTEKLLVEQLQAGKHQRLKN